MADETLTGLEMEAEEMLTAFPKQPVVCADFHSIAISLKHIGYALEADGSRDVRHRDHVWAEAMSNPMTPRLVELVRELREWAGSCESGDRAGSFDTEADMFRRAADAISRLMAEGGLVGAGAAPLAEVVASKSWAWRMAAMLRFLRQHHGECIGDHPEWLTKIDALLEGPSLVEQQEITSALQASEGCGSSNPVDDGAVERALDAFYGLEWRNAPGPNLLRAEMRAALEAAEPHP